MHAGLTACSGPQAFRDVPTEEELFADEPRLTAPLLGRGASGAPDADEGFGPTLRALFSSRQPSESPGRRSGPAPAGSCLCQEGVACRRMYHGYTSEHARLAVCALRLG